MALTSKRIIRANANAVEAMRAVAMLFVWYRAAGFTSKAARHIVGCR
jgi:hypothetical protein